MRTCHCKNFGVRLVIKEPKSLMGRRGPDPSTPPFGLVTEFIFRVLLDGRTWVQAPGYTSVSNFFCSHVQMPRNLKM